MKASRKELSVNLVWKKFVTYYTKSMVLKRKRKKIDCFKIKNFPSTRTNRNKVFPNQTFVKELVCMIHKELNKAV